LDIYHIWCDLKQGVKDTEFVSDAEKYFEYLKDQDRLVTFRITRKKLGLGPPEFLEFHIMLEFKNLSHLDDAFRKVASRTGEVEGFHHAVNSKVNNVKFSLYRDFPDPERVRGSELF